MMSPLAAHCTTMGLSYTIYVLGKFGYTYLDTISSLFGIQKPKPVLIAIAQITPHSFKLHITQSGKTSSIKEYLAKFIGLRSVTLSSPSHFHIEMNGKFVSQVFGTTKSVIIDKLTPETYYQVRVWADGNSKHFHIPSNCIRIKTLVSNNEMPFVNDTDALPISYWLKSPRTNSAPRNKAKKQESRKTQCNISRLLSKAQMS